LEFEMARKPGILIVDDEQQTLEMLREVFEAEGYEPLCAETAEEGLTLFRNHQPDGLILDVNLPGMNGFELGSIIRRTSEAPILYLTAHDHKENRRIALMEAGGDRFHGKQLFLEKPFDLEQLVAEVEVMLRRPGMKKPPPVVEVGALRLDHESLEVIFSGTLVRLSQQEFQLLSILTGAPRKVFSRDELMERTDTITTPNAITQRVRRTRKAFEALFGSEPEIIRTHPSGGYQAGACRAKGGVEDA
jgi:DNA-binding response OmpR family regulator